VTAPLTHKATLTVAGVSWPVLDGSVEEDWWMLPCTTATVRCTIPPGRTASQVDASRVLVATLTLGWRDATGATVGTDESWTLLLRRSRFDQVAGVVELDLVSFDYILDRVVPRDQFFHWSTSEQGGEPLFAADAFYYAFDYRASPLDPAAPPDPTDYWQRVGLTVDPLLYGLYPYPATEPSAQANPADGGAGADILEAVGQVLNLKWRVTRLGTLTWVDRASENRTPTAVITTGQMTVGEFNSRHDGLTFADLATAWSGLTWGQVNEQLRRTATNPTGGVVAAAVSSDLDLFVNTAVVAYDTDYAGDGEIFHSATTVYTSSAWRVGTFTAQRSLDHVFLNQGEAPQVAARKVRPLLDARTRGTAVEVDTVAQHAVASGQWVRLVLRDEVRIEQVQALRIDFPTGLMHLITRPPGTEL